MFSDETIDLLLRENFVEVRLHTDGDPGARKDFSLELQKELATSRSNPWLVVVDPKDGSKIAETGFHYEEGMTEFLQGFVN
ncbi:MAG: hypothetical protein P8N31_02020 [Planctomycetota bacterium]|nr:hypothetical protein [Planctomycetota bacterium]MDG2142310.1 hypothetical protein [Planctomycetota bacterium]